MRKQFKHLNLLERELLFGGLKEGKSLRVIAQDLGRSNGSLSRELKNNTKYGRKYLPCLAQKRAERVGFNQRYQAPLKSTAIFLYVREHLRSPHFWTPQIISGRIGLDLKGASIGVETIYRYIFSRKIRKDKLWRYLPAGRKRRQKRNGRKVQNRGRVPNAISIDSRPKRINQRKEVGHWETDNMEVVKPLKTALSVTVERSLRLVMMTKILNQTSLEKVRALEEGLKPLPSQLRLSITQDNGKENYGHEETRKSLGTMMYFCHAYHSWEKGGVENRNRVIRRFFPKGTDFSKVSDKDIQNVEQTINSTPMKCLQFLTPYEKMRQLISKLGST